MKGLKNFLIVIIALILFILTISSNSFAFDANRRISDLENEFYLDTKKEMIVDNKKNKIYQEQEIKIKNKKGIRNILLVGKDTDSLYDIGRADAILVLTLDINTKKIKLISIMRDSYVKIKAHGEEKINHSYAYGGIKLLRDTIEHNFKIKIDNYAVVDFSGFEMIVDIMGNSS